MKYAINKIIILSLLNSFIWFGSSGQDNIEMQIKEIKAEYEKINKDTAKYKMVQSNVIGQSSEGGVLKKYYNGNVLRKAILTLFGETGQSTSEYYFLNGELIFEFDTELFYKSPLYMGKVEIKSQEETKFYFKNQRLISWIGNDGNMMDGALYPEKEEELLDFLKIIK